MPVPSNLSDLSTTPALNSPAGSESPALVDDYLRTHAAFIKQVSESKDTLDAANVKLTGDQSVAGTKTFSSAPVIPGVNGGQLAGMRNKIINGKMDIAQRGTSFAAAANFTFPVDRFFWVQSSGASVTLSQQADAPSSNEFQNSLRVAVTTSDAAIGAAEHAELFHKIEGFNARDLIGRTFTISFWVRSSKTGAHCVSLGNSGDDRVYVAEYSISAANTWEYKTITVSGGLITAGTWNWTNGNGLNVTWVLAAGSNFHVTAGAWQTGTFTGGFRATANQVNCMDTVGNIFAITGVQLEVGSVATPFEHRPYGAELALCQRYYYRQDTPVSQNTQYIGSFTNTGNVGVSFPVTMRTAPTVTVSFNNSDNTSTVAVSELSNSITASGVRYTFAVSNTSYPYASFNITSLNSAEL